MPARRSACTLPALRLALCCILGCSAMSSGAEGLPPEPPYKGEQGAKEAGKMRAEGKEYVVKDGDVLNFLFNV